MRIGIDARLYGLEHAGLGRYVKKLVDEIVIQNKENTYVLFLSSKHASKFADKKNIKVVVTNIPIYGFLEQLVLPFVFAKEKLDLLHVPHFNAPIFYPGKLVITIHDLIKHHSIGKDTTTRQPWIYYLKRFGYLIATNIILRKASIIICPSEYVKNDIVKIFHKDKNKIVVTYEAVDSSLKKTELSPEEKKEILSKYNLNQPFVIYTGSVYPHKNIEILINAIEEHNKTKEVDLELALVCARSVFWERLNAKITNKGLEKYIKMLGFVEDEDMNKLYSLALALVHPSKMEGFGLTGLEAMKLGVPVVSSNATCLPEIYGDAALYFDPVDVHGLVFLLETIIKDKDLRESLIEKGIAQAKKYSWKKMAKETIGIYKNYSK